MLGVHGKGQKLSNTLLMDVENASSLDKFEARLGAVEVGWNFIVQRIGDNVRVYLESLGELNDSIVSAEFTLLGENDHELYKIKAQEDFHKGGFILGASEMVSWEDFVSCINPHNHVARFEIRIVRWKDCTLCGNNHQ